MSIFLMDGIDWPLLLKDFFNEGMNFSIAFGIMVLVGSIALVAAAVVWQMLGDNQQLDRTNE